MKITTRILVACLPGIVAGALFAATTGERAVDKKNANESALSQGKTLMGKLALSFEPNRGQTDPRVQFLSRGPGYTVFFTKDETVISLKDTKTSNAVVRMRFVGGTNSPSVTPLEPLPGISNYIKGNDPAKWQSGVNQYTKLRYENVYPGIDVVYQGDHQQLRYDFVVKPGASPSAIQMAFQGADKVAVTKDGDLALTIGGKTLVTKKPFTYQEDGGAKKEVASHFVVKDKQVTFELAKYDTTKDVVIDPTVIFVTFLGGTLNDSVTGVAIVNPVQLSNSLPSYYFVTGNTASTQFPTTSGGVTSLAGDTDVFVTEITYNGTTVKWSTYLGGNNNDFANAIAVDIVSTNCNSTGCPVVVGQTFSANFPTVPINGSALNGTDDAFVTKFSSTGGLIFASYYGGTTNDQATGVAVNNGLPPLPPKTVGTCAVGAASPCADIYVGGYTDSTSFLGFLNHGAAIQSSDGFVLHFTGIGSAVVATEPTPQAVLYGGFGEEFVHGLAFNPINNMVYLAGDTTTTAQNFIAPNNVNLPGITNGTTLGFYNGTYSGNALPGVGAAAGGATARGGFVVAFDATTLAQTFGTYVAVSPPSGAGCLATNVGGAAGATAALQNQNCNQGTESVTGIAVEGGAPAGGCSATTGTCTGTLTSSGVQAPLPINTPSSGLACSSTTAKAPTSTPCIAQPYGNAGHIYLSGLTTSNVPSSLIAVNVPGYGCVSGLTATDGTTTKITTGQTLAAGCTTALVTQAPFNQNWAINQGCPYPLVLPLTPNATCNAAAFVAVLDAALLIQPQPTTAPLNITAPVGFGFGPGQPIGNQIEYWAYYSSVAISAGTGKGAGNAAIPVYQVGNSSAQANALAIDSNPTTNTSVYSLGYYQQMYITGSTQLTVPAAAFNQLPVTNGGPSAIPQAAFPAVPAAANIPNPEPDFWPYNVGYTNGGGVGGFTPLGAVTATALNEIDGFVARFNPNGVAAFPYGGIANNGQGFVGPGAVGNAASAYGIPITNGNAPNTACVANTITVCDRSNLIHTPQFNFGEFLYAASPTSTTSSTTTPDTAKALTADGSLGNTVGNAIAVDITRSVIIGGTTNNSQTTSPTVPGSSHYACPLIAGYNANVACLFTTVNFVATTGLTSGDLSGGQNNGGFDGWVATLLFNDMLTDAGAQASANPFLEPTSPNDCPPGPGSSSTCAVQTTYIQTTPPPFGPTFDFAISDPATATQTFEVFFTSNGTSPNWYVPLDTRTGATSPMTLNGHPGSAIVYYIPCYGPGGNAYPAPGGPYGPLVCPTPSNAINAFPNQPWAYASTNGVGDGVTNGVLQAFSGWPSANPNNGGPATPTAVLNTHGQGWLLVTQDVTNGPGVVRLQLDRRAAAGLLEGTYVAQFVITTYDPRTNVFWPPCGALSEQQPFYQTANVLCTASSTPLPADNSSVLITVRLVVHPSLFLSRNSGLVTGVTGALTATTGGGAIGLVGPSPADGVTTLAGSYNGINQENGTSDVPIWPFWDTAGSGAPAPETLPGLTLWNLGSPAAPATPGVNPNAGPPACSVQPYSSTTYVPVIPQNLNAAEAATPLGTTVPCLAQIPPFQGIVAPGNTQLPQPPYVVGGLGTPMAAAAYSGNGPGDLSGGPSDGIPPNLTFLYDSGTVQFPSLAAAESLSISRPDCPTVFPGLPAFVTGPYPAAGCTFNSDYQGFADPVTQRNDATLHSYYIADAQGLFVEGPATLSVAAINCTSYTNPAIGNWLSVANLASGPNPTYTPICTAQTAAGGNGFAVGTVAAPFNTPLIATGGGWMPADTNVLKPGIPPAPLVGNGPGSGSFFNQIPLDFKVTPFTNRPVANGIPTGTYTAQVFVWSTRAKNSVPGYCLGASMGADPGPTGNIPLCGVISPALATGPASDLNRNPEVLVTGQQTFTVSLYVFDTTQIVQITPNSCPTSGFVSGTPVTQVVGVANSENLDTGNGNIAAATGTVALTGAAVGTPSTNVITGTVPLPTSGSAGLAGDAILLQVGPTFTTALGGPLGPMTGYTVPIGGLTTAFVLNVLNTIPTISQGPGGVVNNGLPPGVTLSAALNATNNLVITVTGPSPYAVQVSITTVAGGTADLGLVAAANPETFGPLTIAGFNPAPVFQVGSTCPVPVPGTVTNCQLYGDSIVVNGAQIWVGGNTPAQIQAQLLSAALGGLGIPSAGAAGAPVTYLPAASNVATSLNYLKQLVIVSTTGSPLTIGQTPQVAPVPAVGHILLLQIPAQIAAAGLTDLGLVAGTSGAGAAVVYPQFGPNQDQTVIFSLLPFQTTGAAITQPCPSNNSVSCPPGTGVNVTIPLPAGVTLTPQTLAQYNACALPTGFYGGAAITGLSVPGIGTLQETGAQSQTVFVPAPNGTNTNVTVYVCRPTVAPAWLDSTLYPGNSLTFPGAPELYSDGNGAVSDPVPSTSQQTCPLNAGASLTSSKVGIFRDGVPTAPAFLLNVEGSEVYEPGVDLYYPNFMANVPGGSKAGDIAVSGDWTGDGHYKVGVYRPSTGQWWLDTNNDGVFDAGDSAYTFGGLAGDVPVTGDWTGLGKSCIGVFRQGFSWLLDLNCNGTFDGTPNDAFFPFGGITGDTPVTGAWVFGQPTRVGLVRSYAPGGVVGACNSTTNVGCPFYWVFDSGNPNAGSAASAHQPAAGSFPYGGLFGDVFVSGDWLSTGVYQAGIFRQGFWILDLNGTHAANQTFFGYGGIAGDQPITGKW